MPAPPPLTLEQLARFVDDVPDLVVVVTADARVLVANRAWCEGLGVTTAERSEFLEGLHPEDAAAWLDRLDATLASEDTGEPLRYRIADRDGNWRWHETRGSKLLLGDVAEPVYLGITRDVTDERVADDLRVRHGKMEGIGALAGGIAHDIGNLLTPMIGFSQMLHDHPENQDLVIEFLDVVDTNVSKLDELTRELTLFGRKPECEYRPMDLHATIAEVLSEATPTLDGDIDLDVTLAERILLLRGENAPIASMIDHLVRNAADAMPDGGTLSVTTSIIAPDSIPTDRFPGASPRTWTELCVSDTGIGMDPETREKIFEPFFSTKKKGQDTGLGLTLVLKIVEDHGGHVEVESRAGEGTDVRVFLPLLTEDEPSQSAFSSEPLIHRTGP